MTNTPRREMTMSTYRTLYRGFIREAMEAGIVKDAADFNACALAGISSDVRAAARAGDVDAVVVLCDTAEAWLDEALSPAPFDEEEEDPPSEPDEDQAWRDVQWQRACDHHTRQQIMRSRGIAYW